MPKEISQEEKISARAALAKATVAVIDLGRFMNNLAKLDLRTEALTDDLVFEYESFIQAIQHLVSRAFNLNTILAQEIKFQGLEAPRFYIFKTICKAKELEQQLEENVVPLDVVFNARPYFMLEHAITELKRLRRIFDETPSDSSDSKVVIQLEEELFRVREDFQQVSNKDKAKELIVAISQLENRLAKNSGNVIHHHIYKYDPESHKYTTIDDKEIEKLSNRLSQVETE